MTPKTLPGVPPPPLGPRLAALAAEFMFGSCVTGPGTSCRLVLGSPCLLAFSHLVRDVRDGASELVQACQTLSHPHQDGGSGSTGSRYPTSFNQHSARCQLTLCDEPNSHLVPDATAVVGQCLLGRCVLHAMPPTMSGPSSSGIGRYAYCVAVGELARSSVLRSCNPAICAIHYCPHSPLRYIREIVGGKV